MGDLRVIQIDLPQKVHLLSSSAAHWSHCQMQPSLSKTGLF